MQIHFVRVECDEVSAGPRDRSETAVGDRDSFIFRKERPRLVALPMHSNFKHCFK
jgi:hypothetical protein